MRTIVNMWSAGKAAVLAWCLALAPGCTPPEELDGDDLEPSMDWEDLVSMEHGLQGADRDTAETVAVQRPKARPAAYRPAGSLDRSVALSTIENPAPYAGGILGTRGDSKYFIASTEVVPGYNRLYWVIVKVLSERYSCFMRTKLDVGPMTRFTCKDGRQVLFWKKKNPEYVEFVARQFDREGYEIKVIRKKIVRISNMRVI
jgi:hypothetical protein